MSAKKKKNRNRSLAAHPARTSSNPAPVPDPASAPPSPGRLRGIRLLIGLALAVSAYLAFLSISGGRAVGCGPESGCDKVLNSRWAYWFGVPVSVFALVADVMLLTATFRLGPAQSAAAQRQAWSVLVPCAILIAGAALWFVSLQAMVVRSFCPYCMVAHGSGFVAALLVLISVPVRPAPQKPWEHEKTVFVTPGFLRRMAVVAVLGLAGLVLGQIVYRPASFLVQNISALVPATNAVAQASVAVSPVSPAGIQPDATVSKSPPSSAAPSNPAPVTAVAAPPAAGAPALTIPPRIFPVFNGQFQVDVARAPTIGSPTNAQVMLSLFDYTCHHCRAMHPLLVSAQKMFENRLVIVSLPMPLDPACNPLMQRANPKHANACEFARLGLAVWRANPAKHHSFDDWLFASTEPPKIEAARQFASQVVGTDALNRALADPWIEQQLRQNIAIYETAARAGQGSMPQLHIGQKVAVGQLAMSDLMNLLATNLGLRE